MLVTLVVEDVVVKVEVSVLSVEVSVPDSVAEVVPLVVIISSHSELVFIGNICGFSSNFFADKAKICRHTFVWQEFLTQYATKFAEKT